MGGFGGCSPGTKTGTRAHSPKPAFYEAALLSPSDVLGFYLCAVFVLEFKTFRANLILRKGRPKKIGGKHYAI